MMDFANGFESVSYTPPTILSGVPGKETSAYVGNYIFDHLVDKTVAAAHPNEVYIVYEVTPGNLKFAPRGRTSVKTSHKYVPIIVNGAWLSPSMCRVLAPIRLTGVNGIVHCWSDFEEQPEIANLLYLDNKFPKLMAGKTWKESLCGNLHKLAKGPCT
jgi:hypothetical protein